MCTPTSLVSPRYRTNGLDSWSLRLFRLWQCCGVCLERLAKGALLFLRGWGGLDCRLRTGLSRNRLEAIVEDFDEVGWKHAHCALISPQPSHPPLSVACIQTFDQIPFDKAQIFLRLATPRVYGPAPARKSSGKSWRGIHLRWRALGACCSGRGRRMRRTPSVFESSTEVDSAGCLLCQGRCNDTVRPTVRLRDMGSVERAARAGVRFGTVLTILQ